MKFAASNVSVPPRPPLTSLSSLSRQASIYTLTLEEVQNAVNEPGKTFGSMNMEEFLKSIWTVEESQIMENAIEGNNSSSATGGTSYPPSALQRQASLSLPKNLSGKTVDDVWKEIHRTTSSHSGALNNVHQRQLTMGEITLEDFLVKAGVVREENDVEPSSNSNNSVVTGIGSSSQTSKTTSSEGDWLNFQLKSNIPHQHLLQYQNQLVQQSQHQNIQYQVENSTGFPGMLVGPPNVVTSPLASSTSSNGFDTPYNAATGSLSLAVPSRKRFFDMNEEKPVDPRQKRMIKNRESAARSRARKQVSIKYWENPYLSPFFPTNAPLFLFFPQMSLYLYFSSKCPWSSLQEVNGTIQPKNLQ